MQKINIESIYKLFLQNRNIITDTRNIVPGSIFIGLKGERFDGSAFAKEAIQKGAAYAIISKEEFAENTPQYILVDDTLKTLQQLALYHRRKLKIPIIGITGSNGKTTTKELIAQVLSKKYKTFATKGNLNNHIGVPLSILSIDFNHEIAVIEMGANHIGEIEQLCNIALPDYGIITNIGKAHLEGFGSFEGVIQAKTELYRHIEKVDGTIFYHYDNSILKAEVDKLKCKKVSYGTSKQVSYQGKLLKNDPYLAFEFIGSEKTYTIQTQLFGQYNFENAMAATAIGLYFQVPIELIISAIENYIPSNNRSQLIKVGSNWIICDYYNANPTSMENALINFASSNLNLLEKIAILGEMKELGKESDKEHKKIIELAETLDLNKVFFVGALYKQFENQRFQFFETNADLISYLNENKITDSYVLIKGSRGSKLEEVYEIITMEDNEG